MIILPRRLLLLYQGDDVSYKHLHFSTVCTIVMLIGSLSGRDITVQESRHTSLFLPANCVWLPSHPKPCSLGNQVSKVFGWNLSRIFKTILCMSYIQSFFFSYHMLFDFNISILFWLLITLDVKAPLKQDNTVRGGRLHAEKYRASWISALHAGHTWQLWHHMPLLCKRFHIFPDVHFQIRCHMACHMQHTTLVFKWL